MRSYFVVASALVLVLVTGCGTHPHMKMATALNHQDVYSRARFAAQLPAPFDEIHVSQTVLIEGGTGGDGKTNYPFPPTAFDHVLGEMLRASNGFRTVTVAGEEGAALHSDAAASGLLLNVELDLATVSFMERNGNFGWGIVGWLLGVTAIPSWWIHDEVYKVTATGKVTISDRASERVIAELDLGECVAEDALNFPERTSTVVPYLLTNVIPPTVIAADPDAVVGCLMPVALGDAMVKIRDAIEEAASAPPQALPPAQAPAGLSIDLPSTDAVTFEFVSPVDGDPVGETVDIELKLIFPKDSSDLGLVKINDEVAIEYVETATRPLRKEIPVTLEGVSFIRGKIVISVTFFSKQDPIEVVLRAPE